MNDTLNGKPHQVDGEIASAELIEGFEILNVGAQWKRMRNSYPDILHADYRLTSASY